MDNFKEMVCTDQTFTTTLIARKCNFGYNDSKTVLNFMEAEVAPIIDIYKEKIKEDNAYLAKKLRTIEMLTGFLADFMDREEIEKLKAKVK